MSFNIYCATQVPDYAPNPCQRNMPTGASDAWLLMEGHTFTDFSDPAQWASNEAAGLVKIIKDVNISYPAATSRTMDNPRQKGPPTIQTKLDHVLNIEDPNVDTTNDDFWKSVAGKTFPGHGWRNFETGEIIAWTRTVSVQAIPATDESGNDIQLYNQVFMWDSEPDDFGQRLPAPAGIFD